MNLWAFSIHIFHFPAILRYSWTLHKIYIVRPFQRAPHWNWNARVNLPYRQVNPSARQCNKDCKSNQINPQHIPFLQPAQLTKMPRSVFDVRILQEQIHTFFPWHQLQKPKLSKSSIHADDIALCIASNLFEHPQKRFLPISKQINVFVFPAICVFPSVLLPFFPIFPWFHRLTKVHEHKQLRSKKKLRDYKNKTKIE